MSRTIFKPKKKEKVDKEEVVKVKTTKKVSTKIEE